MPLSIHEGSIISIPTYEPSDEGYAEAGIWTVSEFTVIRKNGVLGVENLGFVPLDQCQIVSPC